MPHDHPRLSQGKLMEYERHLEQTQRIAARLGLRCTGTVIGDKGCITLQGSSLLINGSVLGPWFQGMVEDARILDFQPSMETGEPELLIRFTFDLSAEPDSGRAPHLQ